MQDVVSTIYGFGALIFAVRAAYRSYLSYKSSHSIISTGPASEATAWLKVFGFYFIMWFGIACLPLVILQEIAKFIFN